MCKTVEGTQIQFNVSLELPSGLTMDDVDFTCTFFVYPNRAKVYAKDAMARIDEHNYGVVLDTTGLGKGSIMCRVEVWLPDGRVEKVVCSTSETITGGI